MNNCFEKVTLKNIELLINLVGGEGEELDYVEKNIFCTGVIFQKTLNY